MELDEQQQQQQHGRRGRPPFGRADAYDALQASPSTGHAGSRLSYQTSGGDPSDHGGDYGGRALDLQDQEAGSIGGPHELGMQRQGPGQDLGSYGPSSLSILDFAGPNAVPNLRPVRRRAVSSSGLAEPGSNEDTPPSGEPSGRPGGRRAESARARKQPASQELQEASKAAKISANGRTERELVLLDPKRVRRIIANRQVWYGRRTAHPRMHASLSKTCTCTCVHVCAPCSKDAPHGHCAAYMARPHGRALGVMATRGRM